MLAAAAPELTEVSEPAVEAGEVEEAMVVPAEMSKTIETASIDIDQLLISTGRSIQVAVGRIGIFSRSMSVLSVRL